jgi:Domain of unknown function (DUF6456)
MTRKADAASATLIAALCGDPTLRLVAVADDRYRLRGESGARAHDVAAATVRRHLASGLLVEVAPGILAAAPAAGAWLKRRMSPDQPFRAQHGTLVEKTSGSGAARVVVDLDESPLGALARRAGNGGKPWLGSDAIEAAERLRRDFEVGRLQPRVTANWSASVSTGRRSDGAGLAELTEMALAARLRVDRAMRAVGPELSGVLVDVCCFLKGLATVERERRWPARSAKLVLRLALDALARHYGLSATATGRPGSGKVRHWGAEDYRPEIA